MIALLVPKSAFADEITPFAPGEWDTILDQDYTLSSTEKSTPIVDSGGGDLRVCFSGVNSNNSIC